MPRWFQTTAIDYPNSRPHIGTAFEKLGADVQARYRRMEGYDVLFLMGNDENTLKVADKAKELGQEPQAYCNEMAKQFRQVWDALDISYDVFIQTSSERHKECCRKFVQKVYDNGHIYKGSYEGWYCTGCEEFKSDKLHAENAGNCPNHNKPLIRRAEPCYYFKLSAFKDRLLQHLKENPDFVQPESRRNEMIGFIEAEGLQDLNISRHGEEWGIRLPFDEEFTIYVWFDALLTYITGIGYGDDDALFQNHWPADMHFIGKDITRFHTHIWPAMLWAAGLEAPKRVFSHGFITVEGQKMSKSLGNVLDPIKDVIDKFSVNVDAYRYFFLRECPFPTDGDYSESRFREVYTSELANSLGNLLSRTVTVPSKSLEGVFPGTANRTARPVSANFVQADFVAQVRARLEACDYKNALILISSELLTPADKYISDNAPWKLVKTDPAAASLVLHDVVEALRTATILLKPFIPHATETIYQAFSFAKPWSDVTFADASAPALTTENLRVTAPLTDGKPNQLFPRLA